MQLGSPTSVTHAGGRRSYHHSLLFFSGHLPDKCEGLNSNEAREMPEVFSRNRSLTVDFHVRDL